MTFVVCEPCRECRYTDCVVVCPVDAFRAADRMLVIHPDECIDCGACVPECPAEAIFPESEVPAAWVEYIPLNASAARHGEPITEKQPALPGRCGGQGTSVLPSAT